MVKKLSSKNKKWLICFQTIVKENIKNITYLNNNLEFIYNGICSIMGNLNDHLYFNKLIKKEKYNDYVESVENIFNNYKKYDVPLTFAVYKKINRLGLKVHILSILNNLSNLCEKLGANTCSDVISILNSNNEWKDKIKEKYRKLIKFYDKFFVPISSKLINHSNDINEIIRTTKIEDIHLPFSKNLQIKSKSLLEKIEGATIYFPVNNNLIQINGYFKQDPINITRFGGTFGYKLLLLKSDLEYLEIPDDFKLKYIEQLSLRDFIVLSIREIVLLVKKSYEELQKYRRKSLSSVVKEFVKSSAEKQRRIITLFLISDSEDQFNAHIIFDLIANQSLLFQVKPHAEQIYNSLHWSIKKYFKVALKNVEEKKRKLESLTFSDIPYESRIVSLKASDSVKKRAMNKLKDMGGSKENSSKARQWLEGLLKIPFGIYHEENIFKFYDLFFNKIDNFINITTCKLSELEDIEIPNVIIEKLKDLINMYHANVDKKSENSLNEYIINIEEFIPFFLKYAKIKKINLTSVSEELLKKHNILQNELEISLTEELDLVEKNDISEEIKILLENLKSNEFDEKKKILKKNLDKEKIKFYKDCLKKIEFYKKIKDTLIDNDSLTDNHILMIKEKVDEVEEKLGIKKSEKDNEEDVIDISQYLVNFINYTLKEILNLITEWNNFRKEKYKYMLNVENILDGSVYGHKDAKQQIKRLVGQWINGEMKGQCFGLSGPPGVGKTTICKNGLAKCLVDENGNTRPFAFLALGGASNGSVLEGHNYTYLGSTWGKIADILMETKCMNPIIYVDELDKVSKTQHGKEIIGILTHLTDPVQNKDFQDKYFSNIPLDLSKVLFVFSYNDPHSIDRILRDRIQEIRVKPLTRRDKIVISKRYVLPDIYKTVGFSENEIIFDNNFIVDIIDNYTYEAGVRKLNEILFDIIRELNLKKIMNENITVPIKIDQNFIDEVLSNKQKITKKVIAKKPHVGMVNGLYATNSGVGGITIIEVMHTPSEKKFSIEKLTGSQGDVMKESMHCALTLSWNILPLEIRTKIYNDGNGKNRGAGLHIHCPEASTPKDGPSAGIAITTAIVSRFCNIPIRNTIAMTGEVDLNGNVHKIGGLEAKLLGALMAGVKKVLIPFDNKQDYDDIIKKETDIELNSSFEIYDGDKKKKLKKSTIKDNLNVKLVKNIYEVFKYAFVKNNLEFTKII